MGGLEREMRERERETNTEEQGGTETEREHEDGSPFPSHYFLSHRVFFYFPLFVLMLDLAVWGSPGLYQSIFSDSAIPKISLSLR